MRRERDQYRWQEPRKIVLVDVLVCFTCLARHATTQLPARTVGDHKYVCRPRQAPSSLQGNVLFRYLIVTKIKVARSSDSQVLQRNILGTDAARAERCSLRSGGGIKVPRATAGHIFTNPIPVVLDVLQKAGVSCTL